MSCIRMSGRAWYISPLTVLAVSVPMAAVWWFGRRADMSYMATRGPRKAEKSRFPSWVAAAWPFHARPAPIVEYLQARLMPDSMIYEYTTCKRPLAGACVFTSNDNAGGFIDPWVCIQ